MTTRGALRFKRYPDLDFTLFVAGAEVTIDGWLATLQQYVGEGNTRYEMYDLREVQSAFGADEVRRLAALARVQKDLRPPGSKTALCVARADHYGLSRIYSSMTEMDVPWETNAFNSMEAAWAWLGIDPAEIPDLDIP